MTTIVSALAAAFLLSKPPAAHSTQHLLKQHQASFIDCLTFRQHQGLLDSPVEPEQHVYYYFQDYMRSQGIVKLHA
jgi:hypothetical protein